MCVTFCCYFVGDVYQGVLEPATGEVNLQFEAEFRFTVGSLYSAPPLLVSTTLTTERSEGQIHKAAGTRWRDGKAM